MWWWPPSQGWFLGTKNKRALSEEPHKTSPSRLAREQASRCVCLLGRSSSHISEWISCDLCLTMPPFILGEDLWPRGSPFGLGLLSCVPMLQCWASSWMGPPVAGEPSAVLLMCCVVFPPDPASGAALGSSLEQIKLPAGNNQFSPFILPASAIT